MVADRESKIDIVIPYGPNERDLLALCIESVKKFLPYRNIFILAFEPVSIDGCTTILETTYPFSIDDIHRHHRKSSRAGWYLQQLLKLYFPVVVPDATEDFLVVDADTIFQATPPSFFEDGQIFFNFGDEHHPPYFKQMELLHPSLKKVDLSKSGICHIMPMSRRYLRELFELVESYRGRRFPFWKLFLQAVDPSDFEKSGASEYEIYFNFMLRYHPEVAKLRQLRWANVGSLDVDLKAFDYVSLHWHRREMSVPGDASPPAGISNLP